MMVSVSSTAVVLSPADRVPPQVRSGGSNTLDATLLARPVLIIEDEAVIAWMLESLLEDMGFSHINIAAGSAEAIERAKQAAPGLIVSDINLGAGEMDGVEVASLIRDSVDAAIVFVSGFASPEARRRIARDLPQAAVLRKPVDEADLRSAIARFSRTEQ